MNNCIDEKSLQIHFGKQLISLGWQEIKFNDIIRTRNDEVVLKEILKQQLGKINPNINDNILQWALISLITESYSNLLENNYDFNKKITDGVFIEDNTNDKLNPHLQFIDFKNINNNSFTFIHEYSITQNNYTKRADTILFINGLPLILIEFKSPTNTNISIENAYQQLKNYSYNTPNLFLYNLFSIISDGHLAKYGSITASFERFMTWKKKSIDNNPKSNNEKYELDTLIEGLLNKNTILDILKNFTIFTKNKEKIIPAYHQYYATKKAMQSIETVNDGRAGVIWHTQGSGKSLSMVFLSRQIINNINGVTILIITDRNNLDEQLYNTFAKAFEYLKLPHEPQHIDSNQELIKNLKNKQQGGIIFTTIQKFNESVSLLSTRKNIIVIADEAHRSQYRINGKFKTNEFNKEIHEHFGYAKYMRNALPNAIFIGFTGTPIDNKEKSTYKIFGKTLILMICYSQ
ncbi:type I restriction endonuclease subunit R [Spiroplasma endosymbiont of Polydrusus pterygomalis]|uniref:type I restriction endonuclease subunit R n=1 Tax=Spiroplasma endosymbiont of Polydrusus pterygomalis TaxID=3139327 RepID=UPI003CCAF9A4